MDMTEWNEQEWRKVFRRGEDAPVHSDEWFTRRVMNRLPHKRWSAEIWVSFVVTVAVGIVCGILYIFYVRELNSLTCWTCADAWRTYALVAFACVAGVWQLGSFLRRWYDAS